MPEIQRQYRSGLALTRPAMWNAPPHGPFHYDPGPTELYAKLPLIDAAVETKLGHLPQLSPAEQNAAREVYFGPRADLAHFAFLFDDFAEAQRHLIEESDEVERWAYFRAAFALFHKRCEIVAEHLAAAVSHATDRCEVDTRLAWVILRHLLADENHADPGPWEMDAGTPPAATFWSQPNGGAFAALVGLTGTGLFGAISVNGAPVWQEVRGPMRAFGHWRNERNTPFPTILPALDFTLQPEQLQFATLRNGLAIRDSDGERLGGAEGFDVVWHGVLLVERPGCYQFFAGAPTQRGEVPDFHQAEHHRWRLRIRRGQKTWLLLNHRFDGEEAPSACAEPLELRRGAYGIVVEFSQEQPTYSRAQDACPHPTGFEVKYQGPDSDEVIEALPTERLYRGWKDGPLHVAGRPVGAVAADPETRFLTQQYSSSLRDIRRTYQRAFKALLFAHRLGLSATDFLHHSWSEIRFLLAHPDRFIGTSYFPAAAGNPYDTHHAYLDFNFLPITDLYRPPAFAEDDRVAPSRKRRQALFDWFERLFDYTVMSRAVSRRRERPAWLLFVEAENQQPADPTALLIHLGIDLTHAPVLLNYYPGKVVGWNDLIDERWALRVWRADRAIRGILHAFYPRDISAAMPNQWASSDAVSLAAGVANLTKFYRDGCIENNEPRRYEDIKRLNDGLRLRARDALLAYLCSMNRVQLPWDGTRFVTSSEDLSAIFLLDVNAGVCERATRIEEAATAVQTYVERARLGLESELVVSEAFVTAWDRLFASFPSPARAHP